MNPVPHVSPYPLSCGIGPNSAAVEEWDPIIVCPMPYLQLTTFYGPWVRFVLYPEGKRANLPLPATWIQNSLKWADIGVPGSRISHPR
jgi:hypothetical protein